MWHVKQTDGFRSERKKLSFHYERMLRKKIRAMRAQGPRGDLLGPEWLWETRLREKRAYFAVSEPLIVFLTLSGKKDQQGVIDELRDAAQEIRALLRETKKRLGL